ncbi:coniferyl alcohol acyltransferase-like [Phoenix dactylifera]|uniref:Coniferyl alcohol acyltransferase-like n=1 Tax=Phoenix dactylifera TaxID=42345 RepID=A0A8B7CBC6_PHODC|nr:coniferyl alcohol acyltransferase-like [Phoenix dactylifera]
MGEGKGGCTVTVRRKERVAAVLPLQEHWLPFSNLDLLLPPLDVGVFFCYEKLPGSPSFAAMLSSLKGSLVQALVTYYPFAGEVITNSTGEPELLCNNRGVDFIEAYADVELRELCLYKPDDSFKEKLVPKKEGGVFCVQATELKCGGLVVACSFDHRIADAVSADMFLVAWAELASSKPISRIPSFRRSLLNPRRPGRHDSFPDRLFAPISSLVPPSSPPQLQQPTVSRIYYITAEDVDRMQTAASSGGAAHRTKVEAFTAYLWRVLAKGTVSGDKPCRMGLVVDGRSRIDARAMANYFGNVLTPPYGTLSAEELGRMALPEVADVVHEFLRPAMTAEHFRGLVDWVESHRPEPAVARIYLEDEEGGVACVVSSGRRFPASEVEFGWGKPALASYFFPWGGSTGFVMPMPSPKGNGDWVVYAYLLRDLVEVLEAESPQVFRPLTPDYYLKLLELELVA